MEDLIQYLIDLGIEPIEGLTQVIAFNDAVIYLDVTEDGNPRMCVELFDVDYIDDEISDLIDRETLGKLQITEVPTVLRKTEQPKTQAKQLVGRQLKAMVDELLDEYNDKMAMYMMFGDSVYYERCQQIMKELEKIKL